MALAHHVSDPARPKKKKPLDTADDRASAITALIDVDDLKMSELRKIAKINEINAPFGTRKAELIKILREKGLV